MASLRMPLLRALSTACAVRGFSTVGKSSTPSAGLLLSPSRVRMARSQFLGCTESLLYVTSPRTRNWNSTRSLGARATIKRRKDPSFDSVIQKEKRLRIVNKIKSILVKAPGRAITLLQLGKHRRDIGLTGRRRVISMLNKFPAVFEVYSEGCNVMYVRLTDAAEDQYKEELKLQAELEEYHVEKLRKLVMMSVDKRLTIDKIAHIKHDLGLPEDFRASILPRYPQYFKVVETDLGTAVELTHWDPLLAVSAAERRAAADAEKEEKQKIIIEGEEIVSTALSNRRLNLPKGLSLSKKDRVVALKFQQHTYISPYSDATGLDPASVDAEKRACATVHELLSLTLQKKTLVDHLTHFKKDYKFSQRIRAMLIRHPEMFYVSFKGHRDSVFLREAYEGQELKDKDPQVLARERLMELATIKQQPRRRYPSADGDEEDEEDESDYDDEDEEGDSEDDEDDDVQAETDGKSQEEVEPVRTYAPSPRKPVKTFRDLPPRPTDLERRRDVVTIERPRERW